MACRHQRKRQESDEINCGDLRRLVLTHILESPGVTSELISTILKIPVERINRAIYELQVLGKIKRR